jgi:hypothetical protein
MVPGWHSFWGLPRRTELHLRGGEWRTLTAQRQYAVIR